MKTRFSKQGIYALIMLLGAGILLFRTLRMVLVENALSVLAIWVIVLLIVEFIIDLVWGIYSIRWLISGRNKDIKITLKSAATAIILHALRVLIYVLGRVGPWINFDVKPEYHHLYTYESFWVYFAGIMSILGVVGVIVVGQLIRYKRKQSQV